MPSEDSKRVERGESEETPGVLPEESIGYAWLDDDGTINLQLFASGAVSGSGLFQYAPGHEDYDSILAHLGGLNKGEQKNIPPWPDYE